MGRQTKLDYPFNQEEFIRLLRIAVGPYTVRDFAKKADIGWSTMSNQINGIRKVPPSPNMLIRIIEASDERISYTALFMAAGYDIKKYIDTAPANTSTNAIDLYSENTVIAKSIIEKNISSQQILTAPISVNSASGKIILETSHPTITTWEFCHVFGNPYENAQSMTTRINNLFLACSLNTAHTSTKFSVLTDDKNVFHQMEIPRYSSEKMYISVILVSKADQTVLAELNINTALGSDNLFLNRNLPNREEWGAFTLTYDTSLKSFYTSRAT